MEKWKTQKARFPLSHRARCREQRTEPKEANHKEGGLTVAFIQRQICTIKPRARCNLSARFFCHPSARHHQLMEIVFDEGSDDAATNVRFF